MARQRMLLLIDENVPNSVTEFFRERGHDVHLVRDLFLPGAPDPVIATLGNQMSAVVVTWNHKHFKDLVARVPQDNVQRFRNLGRINFRCNETQGRRRAEQLIDLIEFEYEHVQRRTDKRLLIEIGQTAFRVVR